MTAETSLPASGTSAPAATRLSIRALLREGNIRPRRVALSVGAGTVALGSAVGLAAVAAWLIAEAAQMPSPAALGLAAVTVRFFGISRGLFRYLERLASHETALSGVVELRSRTYDRVARSGASTILGLKRGDIVARMGGDIDAMGDAVVRSIIPLGVAATVSLIAVGITTALLPIAGLVLALCLLASALLGGALTWRSAKMAAEAGTAAAARVSTATLEAIEGAIEHRVWGTQGEASAELRAADLDAERAAELTAKPAAWAEAVLQGSQGIALVASLWLAVVAATSAGLSPTSAAVVALLPLSAFEAVSAVPTAVVQAFRSAAAARRVLAISADGDNSAAAGSSGAGSSSADAPRIDRAAGLPARGATLSLTGLSAAWPGMTPTRPVSTVLGPGGALGIVGRSGIGKTTLLLTIAGALPPSSGTSTVEGSLVDANTLGSTIAVTPEDAHVFGTTVLENLRVARGDATREDAASALADVGLTPWLQAQPDGLDTDVGSGGQTISGGERRRLLLARVLLSPAPIHLIDEPAEHLDADGIDALRSLVRAMRATGRSIVIVTHDLGILDVVDQVVSLDDD